MEIQKCINSISNSMYEESKSKFILIIENNTSCRLQCQCTFKINKNNAKFVKGY